MYTFFLFALSYRRPDFKCDDDAFYPAHDPEGPGWSRKKRIFEGGLRPPQNLNIKADNSNRLLVYG